MRRSRFSLVRTSRSDLPLSAQNLRGKKTDTQPAAVSRSLSRRPRRSTRVCWLLTRADSRIWTAVNVSVIFLVFRPLSTHRATYRLCSNPLRSSLAVSQCRSQIRSPTAAARQSACSRRWRAALLRCAGDRKGYMCVRQDSCTTNQLLIFVFVSVSTIRLRPYAQVSQPLS